MGGAVGVGMLVGVIVDETVPVGVAANTGVRIGVLVAVGVAVRALVGVTKGVSVGRGVVEGGGSSSHADIKAAAIRHNNPTHVVLRQISSTATTNIQFLCRIHLRTP